MHHRVVTTPWWRIHRGVQTPRCMHHRVVTTPWWRIHRGVQTPWCMHHRVVTTPWWHIHRGVLTPHAYVFFLNLWQCIHLEVVTDVFWCNPRLCIPTPWKRFKFPTSPQNQIRFGVPYSNGARRSCLMERKNLRSKSREAVPLRCTSALKFHLRKF